MGGLAAALLADVLGGLLLILGGPAAIWRVLWVFWAQSAGAGLVAALSMRSGAAKLSDDEWLAMAAQTLDAQARRGPSTGQTLYQFQAEIQQRQARLEQLAAIDRRTPEGAAAFAQARLSETTLASGTFGCVFLGFSIGHAVFLLMLFVMTSLVMEGAAAFGMPFTSGDFLTPRPILDAPDLGGITPTLIVMAIVFVAGLLPLLRPIQFAESQAAMKEAMTRTFILQFVLILGAVPAIFVGSAPLAIVFVGVKTAADVYPLWRQRGRAST